MEWSEYLSVGNERIDGQHKEIFRQVNGFIDAINQGTGALKVLDVLNFLVEYTVTHFHDEEEAMRESHYPDLEQHHKEHEKFCRDVLGLKKQIEIKGVNKIGILRTSHAMVNWLVRHILVADKALADHIRSVHSLS